MVRWPPPACRTAARRPLPAGGSAPRHILHAVSRASPRQAGGAPVQVGQPGAPLTRHVSGRVGPPQTLIEPPAARLQWCPPPPPRPGPVAAQAPLFYGPLSPGFFLGICAPAGALTKPETPGNRTKMNAAKKPYFVVLQQSAIKAAPATKSHFCRVHSLQLIAGLDIRTSVYTSP